MNAATVIGPRSWTISLILLDGDEDLGILAPEEDLRDPPRRNSLQLARSVGRVRDRLAVDRQDDVAVADPRLRRRTIRVHVADERSRAARRQLQAPRELRRQVAQRHTEAAALRLGVVAAAVVAPARLDVLLLRVEVELLDGDGQRSLLLVAEDLHRYGGSRLRRDDHLHQLVAIRHGTTVVLDDHVARLQSCFLRGAVRQYRLDDGAGPRLQAELFEAFLRHHLHVDPDTSANHLAFTQLRQQVSNRIDGHGEADADVSLRLAVADDRRVHADDFAADVQQRSPGVAGVDRRVGLQHLVRSSVGYLERALGCADHADADRVRQAERVADGHHPVARLHLRRVAEFRLRQRRFRMFHELNQRAVGERVASDDLGGVGVFVIQIQTHLDLDRVFDDVVVGEDEAVLADDEAGACRAGDGLPLPAALAALVVVVVPLALTLPAARTAEEA